MRIQEEAFVYCWTDWVTQKLYIGSHKGSPDDGYVCSSKVMLKEYHSRPSDFTREIIAFGQDADMRRFERTLCTAAQVHKDESFYNIALPNGIVMSTPEIREAQSSKAKILQS